MKLSELRDVYKKFTEKSSDSARQIAFSGIAIIWVFVKLGNGSVQMSCWLFYSLLLFALSIATDLFHYFYAGKVWHKEYIKFENRNYGDNRLVEVPSKITERIHCIYKLKLAFLAVGYLILIGYLFFSVIKIEL